jgi:hypothetical protein
MWLEPESDTFLHFLHAYTEQEPQSIGTYREKSLHAVFKNYICSDKACQEVPVGPYVADVLCRDMIFEIQTGSFYPLRDKLRYYLENTSYKVTVVHPMPERKWLIWIDPTSGEASKKSRSPRRGEPMMLVPELFWLSDLLPHPRLRVMLYLADMEEYRYLDGWGRGGKRGSHRKEMVPLSLFRVYRFADLEDYRAILPALSDPFTAKAFSSATKLSGRRLSAALTLYRRLGLIARGERNKEGYWYFYANEKEGLSPSVKQ